MTLIWYFWCITRHMLVVSESFSKLSSLGNVCVTFKEFRINFIFSNTFVPNTPLLYPLKISENLKVFWCFQGVKKRCIGNKWVNMKLSIVLLPLFEFVNIMKKKLNFAACCLPLRNNALLSSKLLHLNAFNNIFPYFHHEYINFFH